MTHLDGTLVDVFAKRPLESGITVAAIFSHTIFTNRVIGAYFLVGTLVNVYATNSDCLVSTWAVAYKASNRVFTLQISITDFWVFVTLVNVLTKIMRLIFSKSYFT